MKTFLAGKQTEEQKRSNDYTRYQFILAMMNLDEKMIIPLLKKDAIFLGNKNGWQLLHWFKNQFETLGRYGCHSKLNECNSLGIYPGSETLEFLFAPMDDTNSNENVFSENYNEGKIFGSKSTVKIRLILLFENGKISDIRIPKSFIGREQSKRCQIEN